MPAKLREKLSGVIDDVEAIAKQLRVDVRKAATATGLERRMRRAAGQLQKQAARAAAQVERYVHQVRVELEGGGKTSRKRRGSKAAA